MEFTKEQLIAKAREQIEFCRNTKITGEGRVHVNQCLALFEIALASLEAEPVGYFGRFDTDDEDLIDQCSPSINGAFPLYAAPPAPVSAPDDIPDCVYEVLCQACGGGEKACDFADKLWAACRAAMLQGAEPVTTAYKLPPHIYRELVNRLRDTAVKYQGCQQLREQLSRTLQEVIQPAAPQQEEKAKPKK